MFQIESLIVMAIDFSLAFVSVPIEQKLTEKPKCFYHYFFYIFSRFF